MASEDSIHLATSDLHQLDFVFEDVLERSIYRARHVNAGIRRTLRLST